MQAGHGGGWCLRDHGISETGQWLDGRRELEYVPVGVSLDRRRIESGES